MEESRENSRLLGIAGALNTVGGGSPVDTKVVHFTIINGLGSSIEPLIADDGKEEEGSFAEFVGQTRTECETNTVDD